MKIHQTAKLKSPPNKLCVQYVRMSHIRRQFLVLRHFLLKHNEHILIIDVET